MTDDKLSEIEARLAAATPGPWVWTDGEDPIDIATYESPGYYDNPELIGPNNVFVIGCGEYWIISPVEDRNVQTANAEIIAHAPTDIRALVDEVKALRHDIARHVQITSDQAEEIDRLRDAMLWIDTSDPDTAMNADDRFGLGMDKW